MAAILKRYIDIGQIGGFLRLFHAEISRDGRHPCARASIRAFRLKPKPI
jgi:hypothetical protein